MDGLGVDGVRASNTLLALAKNTELAEANQQKANEAFIEGTSLSDEFAIKNENLAANVAKLGKAILEEVVNSGFVRFLQEATLFLLQNLSAIGKTIKFVTSLGVAVGTYRIIQRLSNKETKLAIFLTNAFGTAQKVLTGQIILRS